MRPLLIGGFCLLLAAFVGLGVWQLDRAAEKRELFDAFAAGQARPARTSLITGPMLPEHRYARLELSGEYLSSKQILLDAMTHSGRVGYQVLTPFRPDGADTWVIVNRGWIPAAGAQTLPFVAVDESRRAVAGRVDALPRPGLRLEARGATTVQRWPRVLLYPTLADVEAALGLPLAPYQLLLDADQADGFVRAWQPRSMPPENHIGYAVQWFSFAVLLAVIAATLQIRAFCHRRRAARDGA